MHTPTPPNDLASSMSVREDFAARNMAEILGKWWLKRHQETFREMARDAIDAADALLAELARTRPQADAEGLVDLAGPEAAGESTMCHRRHAKED